MAKREPLGIRKIEALHHYVHDLERTRRFFVDKLDFHELGTSGAALDRDGRQRAAAFQAGDAVFVIHQPIGEGGRAWRYLRKHPEGVGTVVLQVEDIDRAFRLLDERGATFITDIQRFDGGAHDKVDDKVGDHADAGPVAMFSITTPFGDTTFRFIERRGDEPYLFFPGFVAGAASPTTVATNRFGFTHIDHITSNFQTMKPALLWMEHVLAFEPFWEIAFHTNDVAATETRTHGSGLKSVVMWDPHSGIKFANNEPFRPYFKESQINIFAEDNRGDGVQHSALAVTDIRHAVAGLRAAGVEFMSTPGSYFDMLPERLRTSGIGSIDESVDSLRALEILLDGDRPHQYLLQIFLKEAAGLYRDPEAGPFFFEIIQRKGDQGFGAGNFRALFEAIERDQQTTRKREAVAGDVATPNIPRM